MCMLRTNIFLKLKDGTEIRLDRLISWQPHSICSGSIMAIQLKIDRVLQGSFDLKALNLLFVFQVNCPGCFIYGFPRQQAALEVSSVRLECPGTLNGF